MKRRLAYLVSSLTLLLTGCLQTTIIDEILMLSVLGIDYMDEKETRMTGITPVFIKDQPVKNVLHESIVSDEKHTIDELQKSAIFEIRLGNLVTALFNREYAEKHGIYGFIDYLKREPYVGAKLYLAIVEGESKTLLEDTYGERGNGDFIQNLIKHNIEKHDLPKNNLHLFLFDYFQQGKSPYLPILRKTGPQELEIDGIALLKDDKMVGKIPNEKLFFFKLLVDNYTDGSFRMHANEMELDYDHVKSKLKMKIRERDPYVIDIHIKLKGSLTDYTDGKLDKKQIETIEGLIKEKVEKEIGGMLKQFQELKVDPAGIGAFVKSRTRNFDFKKWEDDYPETTFRVHADVLIRDTGTIE